MFRLSRPLFQALKASTGITGLAVHPNPLPALSQTYTATLAVLNKMPSASVYRQGAEAITLRKIQILEESDGDVVAVESALQEGQIEQAIDIAVDELKLASNILEWKAWEPLEEKPEHGQWEYLAESH